MRGGRIDRRERVRSKTARLLSSQTIAAPSIRHGWPGEGIYRPSRRHIGHRLGLMLASFGIVIKITDLSHEQQSFQ